MQKRRRQQVTEALPQTGSRRSLTRRQRTIVVRTIQYLLIVAVIVFFGIIGNWGDFADSYLNWDVVKALFPRMLRVGLVNTLEYTAGAFVLGLLLGLIIALMRLSEVWLYRAIATVYVELLRGLPTLLVLFLVVYGVPIVFPDVSFLSDFYVQAIVGLGTVAGAYMSETIRAGIQAVPRGQMEAARTLGMSRGRAMISIVIPQAFRIVIPPMTNEIILLVKDSSLVYVLGVTTAQYELSKLSVVASSGGVTGIDAGPTPLLLAGLFYLVITLPLSQAVRALERRQARRGGH
jgi:polar amino acid transport system permease protein